MADMEQQKRMNSVLKLGFSLEDILSYVSYFMIQETSRRFVDFPI